MAPPAKTDALFEWVEQQELEHQQKRGAKPWGRVLDSGTGRHSLSWLLSVAERQKISDAPLHTIVAVTGEQTLADSLTESYAVEAEKTQTSVRVVAGNWVDHSFLQEESEPFDVIIADYLIGSIDGFAPFFQDQICHRLVRLLAPEGRLYLVGLQPIAESPAAIKKSDEPAFALIQEMARVRDACILLGGRRCYREFPMTWCERQLQAAGLTLNGSIKMANVYTCNTVQRQIQVGRNHVALFQDEELAQTMTKSLERLDAKIKQTFQTKKIKFGYDYVIAASKYS